MNVADLELCKELYELSREKWLGEPSECVSSSCTHHAFYDNGRFICPKYTLGYMLRKLPQRLKTPHHSSLSLKHSDLSGWQVGYRAMYGYANTPEDATAKLCIELFKQGILTPDTSGGE